MKPEVAPARRTHAVDIKAKNGALGERFIGGKRRLSWRRNKRVFCSRVEIGCGPVTLGRVFGAMLRVLITSL